VPVLLFVLLPSKAAIPAITDKPCLLSATDLQA
jgi:hypothetical protein